MRNIALKIWEYWAKLWQHHRRDLQIKYPHKYKLEAKSQEQVQNCDKNIVVFRVSLSLQVIYNDSHMIGK